MHVGQSTLRHIVFSFCRRLGVTQTNPYEPHQVSPKHGRPDASPNAMIVQDLANGTASQSSEQQQVLECHRNSVNATAQAEVRAPLKPTCSQVYARVSTVMEVQQDGGPGHCKCLTCCIQRWLVISQTLKIERAIAR